MAEIKIPIAAAGPGSQPAEADGSEPEILQTPSGMDTFVAPLLPEPEQEIERIWCGETEPEGSGKTLAKRFQQPISRRDLLRGNLRREN